MDGIILYSVISLGTVAAFSAVVLFIIAKKFKVEEDPRIDVEIGRASCRVRVLI